MSHPYDTLTPDLILDAVESLGLYSDARILALNSYENRVYQVGIEDADPVIVKFYRPERWSHEQLLEEHQFSQTLSEAELPVIAPQIINGESLHFYQGFHFSISTRRGGHAPELDNLDHLFELGRLLGRIHAIGSVQPFKHRPTLHPVERAQQAVDFLLAQQCIPSELVEAYATLSRDLIKQMQTIWDNYPPAQILRLHGDCHPGNILWRDKNFNFVDFDDCLQGPAIQDLWMLLSGDRQQRELQLSEVISGYDEFYTFDPRELQLIEVMRTSRLMFYSGWLARRWDDPAFPKAFPWFAHPRYWGDQILALREQLAALNEPVLRLL